MSSNKQSHSWSQFVTVICFFQWFIYILVFKKTIIFWQNKNAGFEPYSSHSPFTLPSVDLVKVCTKKQIFSTATATLPVRLSAFELWLYGEMCAQTSHQNVACWCSQTLKCSLSLHSVQVPLSMELNMDNRLWHLNILRTFFLWMSLNCCTPPLCGWPEVTALPFNQFANTSVSALSVWLNWSVAEGVFNPSFFLCPCFLENCLLVFYCVICILSPVYIDTVESFDLSGTSLLTLHPRRLQCEPLSWWGWARMTVWNKGLIFGPYCQRCFWSNKLRANRVWHVLRSLLIFTDSLELKWP